MRLWARNEHPPKQLELLTKASVAIVSALVIGGCSDSSNETDAPAAGGFVVASLVFGPAGTTTYVKAVDQLDANGGEVSFDNAREIPGLADIWVQGSNVFIAVDEERTVQRLSIAGDGSWQEGPIISFANFGAQSVAFWKNTIISDEKAYLANSNFEYVVWDPSLMTIGNTIAIPQLEGPEGTTMRVSFADRAVVLRDGLLYQTVHWANDDLIDFAPNSAILVFDTATNEHVHTIEAPCPGLDTASQDEQGNLYFSNWVFSAGAHIGFDSPENCIVKVPAGLQEIDASWTVSFSSVVDGREGAAARYVSDDKALISVFHDEDISSDADPAEALSGPNWSVQFLDLKTQTVTPIKGIARNSGAFYTSRVGDRSFALVPSTNYDSTTFYEVVPGSEAVQAFRVQGWSLRLFGLATSP